MGRMTAWLARIGAPGGTARWAIKGYRLFRERHPDAEEFPDPIILRLMIVHRYERLRDEETEQALLDRAENMEGLMGLVVEILRLEAGLTDNSPDGVAVILGEVSKELERSKLPRSTLFGSKSGFADFVELAYPGQ